MAEHESIRRRSFRWKVAAGVVLFGVIFVGVAIWPFGNVRGIGHRTLQVRVLVYDAETASLIVNAKVVVFDGPTPMHDGPFRGVRSLRPEDKDTTSKTVLTDEDGLATIDDDFVTTVASGPLHRSGRIVMHNRWVSVDADGYSQVMLPLDGQSMRTRDIDDNSPIFITIVLTKQR